MTLTPVMYSFPQSFGFFAALREVSIEILMMNDIPISPGYKSYDSWIHDDPIGVIEHYTAGPYWKGSARWLNNPNNKHSSCHILILDHMPADLRPLYDKHKPLKCLPAAVILLSEFPFKPTWHAGWVNRLCIGIENRNCGRLRQYGNDCSWCWWANNWTAKFPDEKLCKTPVLIDRQWWEPYTANQIRANIIVGQHLHCFYNKNDHALDPSWFLPHSAVSDSKLDTGRAFPLNDVRDAVFQQMPIEGIPWFESYIHNQDKYVQELEGSEEDLFMIQLEQRQLDRRFGEVSKEDIEMLPPIDLQDLIDRGSWRSDLNAVRIGLVQLGYVTSGVGEELDERTALAVYQFQRSVGLQPDKIPGDKTQRALYARLTDFRLQR